MIDQSLDSEQESSQVWVKVSLYPTISHVEINRLLNPLLSLKRLTLPGQFSRGGQLDTQRSKTHSTRS
jgi:hypothetical protein